ncbi:MAG: translation initiation factor IF-3 [Acidobacteria bacterium]|nr:translation initiation factor IF-3 [Acidobacteriota bacterium]
MSTNNTQKRPLRQQEKLPQVRINDRIRVREIRVIDEDGGQLGIMAPQQALDIAKEKGLDLVEVAPQAQPPVCRIINYGKWQYEQKKKAHAAKQKQTTVTVKEIKFRPATDEHDYQFKKNNAVRMLQDGDKVKASVRFRGREITHREIGQQLLERLEADLNQCGTIEVKPKMEGMVMFSIFGPKHK